MGAPLILKVRAILWLHILRFLRFKLSFTNYVITIILWYAIFILGALMFIPREELPIVAPLTFWSLVMWNIISNSVWLIGGWTWFFVSQGFVEEHMLLNTRPSAVLVGRAFTGLMVSLVAIILVMLVFIGIVGEVIIEIQNLALLIIGLIELTIMAICYGLFLAALSFVIRVPGTLLDVANFVVFIIGGVGVPINKLPDVLKYVAIAIPYSHAAEIVRCGVVGIEPYLGLRQELFISSLITISMIIASIYIFKIIENHIRRHGVKAIGRM